MAARDTQRYYWVKISSKWFFRNHKVELVRGSEVGHVAILMYIFMLAESASHDGRLRCDEDLPYTPENIVTLCHVPKDDGLKAFELLKRYNLVKIEEDGTIFMPEFAEYVGSETEAAERKREYRNRVSESPNSEPASETHLKVEEPKTAPVPSAQSPKLKPAAAAEAERNATIDTAPLHAPMSLERMQELVKRSAGQPRVMIGSTMITPDEIATWFAFQETEGGWRVGQDFKPITVGNFMGPLKAYVSARRVEQRAAARAASSSKISRAALYREIARIVADPTNRLNVTASDADGIWAEIVRNDFRTLNGYTVTESNVIKIIESYCKTKGRSSGAGDDYESAEIAKAKANNAKKAEWREQVKSGEITKEEFDRLCDTLPS